MSEKQLCIARVDRLKRWLEGGKEFPMVFDDIPPEFKIEIRRYLGNLIETLETDPRVIFNEDEIEDEDRC